MSDELKLKPPKTIYLQWDEDPLAENTWCETPINDDDIKYVRSDRYNKLVDLGRLMRKSMAHNKIQLDELVASQQWDDFIREYDAMKGRNK